MTMVCPASTVARSRSSTLWADVVSSAPVGSSANRTSGRVTSARAMATRCCWPPDSSRGRCRPRSARPTDESAAFTSAREGRRPASRSGRLTFCSAVSDPTRLKLWNTNPIRERRQGGQLAVGGRRDVAVAQERRARRRRARVRPRCAAAWTCPSPKDPSLPSSCRAESRCRRRRRRGPRRTRGRTSGGCPASRWRGCLGECGGHAVQSILDRHWCRSCWPHGAGGGTHTWGGPSPTRRSRLRRSLSSGSGVRAVRRCRSSGVRRPARRRRSARGSAGH